MPTAADAAQALGTVHATTGRTPRVRRAGTKAWKDAPVGTEVYGGDHIDSRGEGSIRHADGSFVPLRKGALVQMEERKKKAERKKLEIVSGEADFGRE